MSERTGSTPADRPTGVTSDGTVPADEVPGWPATRTELLERAAEYARSVDIDVDVEALEWEISERAKRRAGGCRYDAETGQVTVLLTWEAYRAHGWDEFTGTIRHELVHAWELYRFGKCGHGERFRAKAREVDAPRFCQAFTDGRLRLVCTAEDCEWAVERHRASKTVKFPGRDYVCGQCGSDYLVRHVATGHEWQSNREYRQAREMISDDW